MISIISYTLTEIIIIIVGSIIKAAKHHTPLSIIIIIIRYWPCTNGLAGMNM
ncbi:hypothetical protein Sjap_020067 [Stephania japonica]|uniref:Uncharacterized protein n=1 Tax=Stephania japonica TaxID=461633 RepID=A0AAP0F5A5_9MAGN